MTGPGDAGHDAIVDFYDRYPYPPPVDDLDRQAAAWRDGRLRRIEHARLWPRRPYRDDHTILVAGCGTAQAARYALRYRSARVVGIDVSRAALEHTRTLASRYGLDRLELHELPIEEAATLGERFDHIVCTGVLHHLADPGLGLRALADVLAPGGATVLMLYARYGRTGVTMLQDYCRMLGVTPTSSDVDDLVRTLRELPLGHPLGHLLRSAPDFADPGALADALLNPHERAYTVAGLLDLVAGAGLRFARWVRQAPYVARCGVMAELPHARRLAALPIEQQFAAMELFRGTMTRHSFIAVRADDPVAPISFDGEAWRQFVPIRTAGATAVRDRTPHAAAVLLERSHSDTDLVTFVDARRLEQFEAIDGTTPIGAFTDPDPGFFAQLWWHDLIVVDASADRLVAGPGG